jgi:NADH-quinone oxidoreductase subunit C/D
VAGNGVAEELRARFPEQTLLAQDTADAIPTLWLPADQLLPVANYLKHEAPRPFRTLYDLTAIDERERTRRPGQPPSDFTLVYQLLSYERNADVRLKVALVAPNLEVPSLTSLWPSANWYEREVFDMFGIAFAGHPDLRRLLMPPWWEGHPLRKDHVARATEMGVFELPAAEAAEREQLMR